MRIPGIIAVVVFVITILPVSGFADCNPRSVTIPPAQIRGILTCHDGTTPASVEILELKVDGVVCPPSEYDFTFPFLPPTYDYKLEFWMDNTVAHTVSVCIKGTCYGTETTGGFSLDSKNPYPCDSELDFPQYSIMIVGPIVLDRVIPNISHTLSVFLLILLPCIFIPCLYNGILRS